MTRTLHLLGLVAALGSLFSSGCAKAVADGPLTEPVVAELPPQRSPAMPPTGEVQRVALELRTPFSRSVGRGATCATNEVVMCTTTCGTPGSRACDATGHLGECRAVDGACKPPEVVEPACRAGDEEACETSCGTEGRRTCASDGRWPECVPPAEVCGNGQDDNCDGRVDEGCAVCDPGARAGCVTACGTEGQKTCGTGGLWDDACRPLAEICGNGIDDNCDGRVDEGCPVCTPGVQATCVTACGTEGRKTCGTDGQWDDACRPPAEICGNGVDDNCDGRVDEGCTVCTPGVQTTCTSACGSEGRKTCLPSGQWDTVCAPPAEVCGNGRDDNCDGRVDEGCPVCTPGVQTTCTTSCGSEGRKTCNGSGQWGTCTPPPELCGNGRDDNCDGRVDEGCVVRCEDSIGNTCNGDPGYGDRCAPSENTGGCSSGRFWAWCNRRNDAYPNIWENFLRNWVVRHCDGQVRLEGGQYASYICTASSGITYSCTTPLVLSFEPEVPVQFDATQHGFSLDPALGAACYDWPRAQTPWLAFDRDGSGVIEDGRELFGSATPLLQGGTARHGFEALAELDDDGDGRIDARDSSWRSLLAWSDRNGDGLSQPDELTPVAELGLQSISLGYDVSVRCDARGNCERERSAFVWQDTRGARREGAVIDVYVRARVGCTEADAASALDLTSP